MSKNNEHDQSQFWVAVHAQHIAGQYPGGEIIISSGHSPSGKYHFGTLREPMTASVLAEAIRQHGRSATHIDFIDDFDVLRKIPAGIPKDFEQYLGMPLYLAPSPVEGFDSYADYYLHEWFESYQRLGIEPRIYRSHEQYQAGKFIPYVENMLENLEDVKEIIQRVSKRELPKQWAPVQLLSDDNYLNTWNFKDWDKQKQTILYEDENGEEGELDYASQPGRVKLDWRLDWPARWHMLDVDAEPFGRDHAAKGGSYDTGEEIVRSIFNGQAPYPIRYEFINIAGETKKMSKSAGNVITPKNLLQIMPPSLLRYFILRSRADKPLYFYPGEKLMALYDEYKQVSAAARGGEEHEFMDAYRFADIGDQLTDVPFSHLASVYQAAHGDIARIQELLERTGYEVDRTSLEAELSYVKTWLDGYAPEHLIFQLQEELPEVKLDTPQVLFLANLARKLEGKDEWDPEWIHNTIHELKQEHHLGAAQAFGAIYLILFGQSSGPKVGWYLTTLDKDWLLDRLRLER